MCSPGRVPNERGPGQGYMLDNLRRGCDKLYPAVRSRGFGKCRLYRVYKTLRLNIKRRGKRRLPERLMMGDPDARTKSGRQTSCRMRCGQAVASARSNVIDDYNREVLRIEIDTSLPVRGIVRVLDKLVEMRGKPVVVRMDNGTELISDEREKRARRHGIERRFIQLVDRCKTVGSNASRYLPRGGAPLLRLRTLCEARRTTADWIPRYNENGSEESPATSTKKGSRALSPGLTSTF